MNLTYRICDTLITKRTYTSKEDMQIKLNVFYANNQLNTDEYETLTAKLESVEG